MITVALSLPGRWGDSRAGQGEWEGGWVEGWMGESEFRIPNSSVLCSLRQLTANSPNKRLVLQDAGEGYPSCLRRERFLGP